MARPVLLAGGSSGPVLPGGGLKGRYLSRCASSVEVAPRGRYSMGVCCVVVLVVVMVMVEDVSIVLRQRRGVIFLFGMGRSPVPWTLADSVAVPVVR